MHTHGTIYAIDFDGTVVTHEFPKIGKELPYCIETLREIVAHGGKLILWTMRSDKPPVPIADGESNKQIADKEDYLTQAVNWFKEREIPLWGIQRNPDQDKWTSSPKAYAHIYIDDAGDLGCYTMQDPAFSDRRYVDWALVSQLLFPEE